MIIRHGVPATLTTIGRVTASWTPGKAESLTGFARWREIWRRLRRAHNRHESMRIAVAVWRHGVALSGPATPNGEWQL